jgi:hypothetical protein
MTFGAGSKRIDCVHRRAQGGRRRRPVGRAQEEGLRRLPHLRQRHVHERWRAFIQRRILRVSCDADNRRHRAPETEGPAEGVRLRPDAARQRLVDDGDALRAIVV